MQWLVVLALFFLPCFSFGSESIRADHINIDLLSPEIFSTQEEALVGIRFRPDPHWHVYWKNPGDSGAAPKFEITANEKPITEVLWPYPVRLPVAHLTNLGYEGEVAYLFKVQPDETGLVNINVKLEWLVCQEECVPGFGTLTLARPVSDQSVQYQSHIKEKLDFFFNRVPLTDAAGANSTLIENVDGTVALKLALSHSPASIETYPVDPEYLLPSEPQKLISDSDVEFVFQKSPSAKKPMHLSFVVVADDKPLELNRIPFSKAQAELEPTSLAALLALLLSAFAGGVILNLMPCVFPVISIKAVSLLKSTDRTAKVRDGIQYTFGVLITFVALGAGFLLLRSLGSAVGWGFQLQSPLVVFGLILLFWLMALNFLGVYDFGSRIMNSTGRLNWQSSFGTGVLSVFVAAPCTGPFMGTALGATATLPSYQALLVFLCLGLGLASPYLAITLSDRLAKVLPKPGAWMETLKQFFAFPLFATILWLLWVLGLQTGTQGWVNALSCLLVLAFALWLGKRQKKLTKVIAWFLALVSVVYFALAIYKSDFPLEQMTDSAWEVYSEEKLQAALAQGQPVFVDFTAAWCITCQVNKKAVLDTDEANQIFETKGILRLRGDWTKQDPVITQALSRLGRNSVPVYAFYSKKNSRATLLPQILTLDMIRNLDSTKEEE